MVAGGGSKLLISNGLGEVPLMRAANIPGLSIFIACFCLVSIYSGVFSAASSHDAFVRQGAQYISEREPDYTLLLRSRQFVPDAGTDPVLAVDVEAKDHTYAIVQFWDIPSRQDVGALRANGVRLLDYVPKRAYFACIFASGLDFLRSHPAVRATIPVRPEDRIHPRLRSRRVSSWARHDDGTIGIDITFMGNIGAEVVHAVAEAYGTVLDFDADSRTVTARVSEAALDALMSEETVQWISEVSPPATDLLDKVRSTVGADLVQAPPYDLHGAGVTLAMWESSAPATTHEDFLGRLTLPDGAGSGNHATQVAGIMAGDGSRSLALGGTPCQWRGMADSAQILSYSMPTSKANLKAETNDAISRGAILSHNSWGWYVCGTTTCDQFGDYDGYSVAYDNLVRGSQGAPISIVFGAGNNQDCVECQDSIPDFPYRTTPGPGATAKNVVAVGATNSLTDSMTDFSSWGPVDDGRVKPDLVAPGCYAPAGVKAPWPPNEYFDESCGTSYSGPVISGSIGILREQFDRLGYGALWPHTLKAILIQTARDLGNPGPDYQFGHGRIELKDAVDLVIANWPNDEMVRVDSVANGEEDIYYMEVPPGAEDFRITLVWDDYKGTAYAAQTLVNDLDLVVQSPGATSYYAYVLDPANPSVDASTGYNGLDNVEVVEVASPGEGRWSISIRGETVPEGPQDYTVVLPYEYPSGGIDLPDRKMPGFRLYPARPNPFSLVTTVRFDLAEPGPVRLRVYDIRGRMVKSLIDVPLKAAGRHVVDWDATDRTSSKVSQGIYFCRLESGTMRQTIKVTVAR
jgi:hypothetical protein